MQQINTEDFQKRFGDACREARKKMGESQVSAAQKMVIDYRHYQNVEGGKINLRLDTFLKLVNFYQIDLISFAGSQQGGVHVDHC